MRFAKLAVFYPPLLAGLVFSRPAQYPRSTALPAVRDLLGLLGEDTLATVIPDGGRAGGPNAVHPATPTTNVESHGSPTRPNMAAANGTPASTSTLETTPTPAGAGPPTLMIGTILTSSLHADPAAPTATATSSSAPGSTDVGYIADASSTPPAELTEWKVIGIAVITITFIATVILSVTFFDAWWGFLCAAVCGKRRGARKGGEEMVPDWEKRSWEFRLANEDGHRYPTMMSLESIVKEKEKAQAGIGIARMGG